MSANPSSNRMAGVPPSIRVKGSPNTAAVPPHQAQQQQQPPRRRSRSSGPRQRVAQSDILAVVEQESLMRQPPRPRSRSRGPTQRVAQSEVMRQPFPRRKSESRLAAQQESMRRQPLPRRKSESRLSMAARSNGKSYREIRAAYNIPTNDTLSSNAFNRSANELIVPTNFREEGRNERLNRSYNELLAPNRNAGMNRRDDSSSVAAHRNQRDHDDSERAGNNSTAQNTNMRRRKSFNAILVPTGGYATDMSDNNSNNRRGNRRGSISDGSDGGQRRRKGGFRRRLTHDGSFTSGASSGLNSSGKMPLAFASKRRGSMGGSDSGGENYASRSDGSTGRRGSMGMASNLKPLPEHKSFRGSAPFPPIDLDELNVEEYMQKDLNDMSAEELQAELKTHGIAVQGMFDRQDLVGVCAQARKRHAANLYKPVRRNSSNDDLKKKAATENSQQPQRRRSSGNLGTLLDLNDAPPKPGDKPRRKRRTIDSKDSAGFSANPQQGMGKRASITATRGSDVPDGGRVSRRSSRSSLPGSGRMSHRSSRSSLSSMGLNLEDVDITNEEMAVLNAPLGAGLSGIGHDVENPNQQMGLLLQQMQMLEGQMGEPQEQPRQKMPRRKSGHAAAAGAAFLSVHSSRVVGGETAQPRRMSHGSHRSGGSWYVGADPSADASRRSGVLSRNSSHNSLSLLASELEGVAKMDQQPRRGTMGSGGAPGSAKTDQRPRRDTADSNGAPGGLYVNAPQTAGGDAGSVAKTDPPSVLSSTTGKGEGNAKKPLFSKKAMFVGAFLLLVAGGALTASLMLFAFKGEEGEESVSASPQQENSAPFSANQYIEAPPSDIEGRCSPSNLPGSLNACLSACLSSSCCYPNYSQEKSCINENDQRSIEACERYRPYCDIFYDAWPGATEGVLRSPPQNLVQMCVEDAGSENVDDKESNSFGNTESFERKRLRHHATRGSRQLRILSTTEQICARHCKASRCCHAPAYTEGLTLSATGVFTSLGGDHVVTNCQADFGRNEPLCEEYDKFCNHDSSGRDADDESSNASLSLQTNVSDLPKPSFSPTTSLSPSSRPSAPQSVSQAWTNRPTPTSPPTLSSSPSATPSRSQPSSAPTHSSRPTISRSPSMPTLSPTPPTKPAIHPANTLEIAGACSGAENVEMISSGNVAARTKCIGACQQGLCCYSEMLGYGSWMPSCYVGNEGTCLEYYPCLVLVEGEFVLPPAAGSSEDNTATPANSTTDTAVNAEDNTASTTENTMDVDNTDTALQPPTQDLASICSRNSLFTSEGLALCVSACQPASCCDVQMLGQSSCYFDIKETCDLYSPCINLNGMADLDAPAGDAPQDGPPVEAPQDIPAAGEPQMPPEASANLATVCSYESLAASDDGATTSASMLCSELCQPGLCCTDGLCLGDDASPTMWDGLKAICESYSPCLNLNLLTEPPRNMDEICDGSNNSTTDECDAICSAVSCCFSEESSLSDNNDTISSCYAQFEETCLAYAPYCAPTAALPSTTAPATATAVAVNLPPPPPDLAALCSFSADFCATVCQAASCCFVEPTTEAPSCADANEERCGDYAPCASLYGQAP